MDTGDGKRCLVLLDCKTNKPRTTECHWITLTTRVRAPFLHCNSILIEGGIVRRVVLVLGLKKRQRAYIQKAKGRIVRDSSICNCCVKTTYVCTCRAVSRSGGWRQKESRDSGKAQTTLGLLRIVRCNFCMPRT
jgi:hypothetical protein